MSMFRFFITGHGYTGWENETVKHGIGVPHTAPERLTELRRKYPDAAIMIEREGDNRKPSPLIQYRFQIKQGEEIRYSRLVNEDEKEAREREIRTMFPDAEISEVKF